MRDRVIIMSNIKLRFLEGTNLYSKDNLIYLKGDGECYRGELLKVVYDYMNIGEKLKLNSYIDIVEKNDIIEVLISSNNIYLSNNIIKSLMSNSSEETILNELESNSDNEWSKKLKEIAISKNIPYTRINENEVILGYGENSFKIDRNDYISKYDEDYSKIFNYIDGNVGEIPIISVTGTNGKTTTVRLIHKILLDLGYRSGLASTGGIYIGSKLIKYGDTTGFYSAREVLKNKDVNVAVLETARGGILKKGLGYKNSKVAIITSLSEDHIGMENIKSVDDLINIKSVITEELDKDGILIIKAIPTLVERFKDRNNVILFNYFEDKLIKDHTKRGNIAYYVKEDYIVKNSGGIEEKVISIKEIPFAFNGISKSNIRNVMVAMIATEHICKNMNSIIDIVKKIECDIYNNLGRQNILDFNDFKMIIDYGHNSEAFKEVFSIARSIKNNRIIGVITAAGDREDIYIKELGEIAAEFCDKIIIKEQPDLRGRKKGETAELLKEGALNNKYNSENIKVILEEEEAILYALRNANVGDVIVSFSQFLYLTFPVINKFRVERGLNKIGEDLDLMH